MTLLELEPAPARAKVVSSCLGDLFLKIPLLSCRYGHHFLGQPASPDQVGHNVHGFVRVFEESLIPGAQVVQSRLPIGRLDETVLGTFAAANRKYFAFPANEANIEWGSCRTR